MDRSKMLRGELYLASDPELVAARVRARRLWRRFNGIDPDDAAAARSVLAELLGSLGAERTAGPELARAITIGPRAWLGGGVIVGPGVTIGADTVVGAGSIVVRDLPAGVLAVGNPCGIVRHLDSDAGGPQS